ncbi:MAG: TRAP transporter large permease [Sphaerochaetaceae bacterium]|nr:TRAP transporter large permease [Sphaerochaetaceae bacterium]
MSISTLATIVLIGGFFLLMFLKIPVTFSLLLSTCAAALIEGTNLTTLIRMMIDGVNNISLLSIPFFILMGEIMSVGEISDKIVALANLVVGRFRGGLAYVNCLDSMFFGGVSGSAVADVSSLGAIVIPLQVKQGYSKEFAVALTVTTACEGVLIPPSHNMVIYALAAGAGVSIGSMFMAGIFPGILLGGALMFMCFLMRFKYNFPKGDKIGAGDRVRWMKFSKGGKWSARKNPETWAVVRTPLFTVEMGKCMQIVLDAILPMMTLVIIMVGVAVGIFTATESSAIACVYTFLLTYVVYKKDKIKNFPKVLKNSLKTLAVVMTLLATAKAFAYMMTALRIPAMLTNALLSITDNKYILLIIINLILLLLGCFMDMAPLILIMTPILLPVVTNPAIGMSPIHFGIMLILNLATGLCTPPVGSALFVGCAVGGTTIEKTTKALLPMFLVMFATLMAVTFIPSFSLLIPNALGMAV